MEVLNVAWTTTMDGCIGIIKAKNVMTDEILVYIGIGEGKSEEADVAHILAYGDKMSLEVFLKSMLGI